MTGVFRSKLQELPRTLELQDADEQWRMAQGLRQHGDRPAIAVGSGGSAISAAFLASCRRDISTASTLLATPMEFVLGTEDVSDTQLWLFSGRGDNADVMACLEAAADRNVRDVRLVTSNPIGRAAERAKTIPSCTVHLAPVADPKDGFLSTHSLIAAMGVALAATDIALGVGAALPIRASLADILLSRLTTERIAQLRDEFLSISPQSTIVLLSDPALTPSATTLETSIWECALCSVQRTDMRNFAHGRHVLLARRPEMVHVVGLTTLASAPVWNELLASLPPSVPLSLFHYGAGSRRDVAASVVDALMIVQALGDAVGVDPGKPGVGEFAKTVYEGRSLEELATALQPPVRHKLRAIRQAGPSDLTLGDIVRAKDAAKQRLAEATFDAVILDYDGTIVATENRYQPPRADIAAQLTRLLQGGAVVGIATGRGGSVGEDLRKVLPTSLHERVIVGYYNGGYVKALDVDIRREKPQPASIIQEMVSWLRDSDDYPATTRNSALQLSITMADVEDLQRLERRIADFPGMTAGKIRVARSKHSIDIGVATNTKLNVRRAIALLSAKSEAQALCIGDSGHVLGNDFELLGEGLGVSVDSVCHRSDGCWNLFGERLAGPSAVVKLLDAIELNTNGTFRLALGRLTG